METCSELPNGGGKPYDAAVASPPSAASVPAVAAAAEEGRDPSPTNPNQNPPLGSPIPTTLAPLVLRGHGDDGDDGEEEVRYNYSPDDGGEDGEDDYDDDSSEDGEIVFQIKSRKPAAAAAAAPAAVSNDDNSSTVPKMDEPIIESRSPIGTATCTATGASSPDQGVASPPGQPSGTVAAKNSPPVARGNAVSSESSSPVHDAHVSTTTCTTSTPAQPSNNDGPSTPGTSPDAAIAASSRKSRADRLAAVTGRGRQRFSVGSKSSLKKILGKIGAPSSSSAARDGGEDTNSGSGDAVTSASDSGSGSGSPNSANADAASPSSSPASTSSKQASSSPKALPVDASTSSPVGTTTASAAATPAVDESVSSYFSSLITASDGGGSGGKKKKARSSTDKKKKKKGRRSTSRSPNAAVAAPSPNSSSSSSAAATTRDDNVRHAAAAADGAKDVLEDAKSDFTEFSDSTPLVTPRLPEDDAPVVDGDAVVANAEGSPEVSPLVTPPVEDGAALDQDVEAKPTPPTLPNVGEEEEEEKEKDSMAAVDVNVQTNAESIGSENPTRTSKFANGASPAPTKPNALLSGLSTNYSPSLHMPKYSENELNTKIDNAIRKAEREWRQNAKDESDNAMSSELEALRKSHRSEMERIYREHQTKLDEEKKLFEEKIAEAAKNEGSVGELQTKIESFKMQMEQDKAKHRSDLEKMREDKEQEIERITSECEKVFIECEERITALEQQLDKKKKTVEGLSQSVSDAQKEKKRLEGQLEQNEVELEKLKLQIEEDRAAAHILEEKIAKMQANHKSKLCLAYWLVPEVHLFPLFCIQSISLLTIFLLFANTSS